MKTIIVGLGNPGSKFNHTRHNAGFMVVDFFAQKNDFPEFTLSKKYDSLISEKEDLILVKPQTFMNDSGKAVKKITTHYKLLTTNFIIIHDDIDIPLGKIKISKDSGAGGHKGVDSIITTMGTKDFVRIKIGIAAGDEKAEDVVLKKFSPGEKEILDGILQKTADALNMLISEAPEKAMNRFN